MHDLIKGFLKDRMVARVDRRRWLVTQARVVGAVMLNEAPRRWPTRLSRQQGLARSMGRPIRDRWGSWDDPSDREQLARRGVAAAQAAGARYADMRITRREIHRYAISDNTEVWNGQRQGLGTVTETVGIGVRVLVDGYWGFSASTIFAPDEIERLAHDAVGQARTNAQGSPAWHVDLGVMPAVTGRWRTPVRLDPFAITIEEKTDYIQYLSQAVDQVGLRIVVSTPLAHLKFVREECVLATSEGSCLTQTCLESGGYLKVSADAQSFTEVAGGGGGSGLAVHGIAVAGAGWELILDANIPEQLLSGQLEQELRQRSAIPVSTPLIGKHTLVCDGATMGRLVEATLGLATQLDRALGYEANAVGTTVFDDPLGMLGNLQLAPSNVTITANRSAPQQLATVQWDDEGVAPESFPLVKDGVLADFQTTREQAAWLAPYYTKAGKSIRSHGCAAAESAHGITLQQMPNLALEPVAAGPTLAQLVSEVSDGILLQGAVVPQIDSQGKRGLLITNKQLDGSMRKIKNGRLGAYLADGAGVFFDSQQLWKKLLAVGGPDTQATVSTSKNLDVNDGLLFSLELQASQGQKGQPPQRTGRSIRAAAAVLPEQPLITASRI